jgi:hypothetical protein
MITGTLCVLSPNLDALGGRPYRPTGIALDEAGDVVIANWTGNNLLVARPNVQNCTLTISRTVADGDIVGPENIVLSEDGTIAFAANYDGGDVAAIELGSGRIIWRTPAVQAHGIALAGKDRVVATSLGLPREVLLLNRSDGSVVKRIGKVGWEGMKGEFLWPVSIDYSVTHRLFAVLDAHQGAVTLIDDD